MASENKQECLFSFGIITDIQYGDVPDGHSFHGNPRYYRDAIFKVKAAVDHWNQLGNIKFLLNLGDTIDGLNRERSEDALQEVLSHLHQFNGPVYHTFGNHELYHIPRHNVVTRLGIKEHQAKDIIEHDFDHDEGYYSFTPSPGWRIAVLDTYDISVLGGRHESHPNHALGKRILIQKNPNENKNDPPKGFHKKRYTKFNGGVSEKQLAWLRHVLEHAVATKEKVIICGHTPIDPHSASPSTVLWNHEEVTKIIEQYHCVVVSFFGHDHKGGYRAITFDNNPKRAVHVCTLEAVLETPVGMEAHGIVEVYHNKIKLIGYGAVSSYTMPFEIS